MPIIKLPLISAIKKLRNKEFMQLYLQMMDVTEKYAGSTQNENLEGVFDRIQKEVECVKQLDRKQ